MKSDFLNSAIKQFEYYKSLGEKTFAQLSDDKLFWQYNTDSNSIGTIVKHLSGNMLSRWTDFLHTDGEKEWRNREAEFDNDIDSREQLMDSWNKGWNCLFDALGELTATDLEKEIYIRNEGHSVMEAINRQLAHYPYHIGQIVYIGKMASIAPWESLSIPRGGTAAFNQKKFAEEKQRKHFTDDELKSEK